MEVRYIKSQNLRNRTKVVGTTPFEFDKDGICKLEIKPGRGAILYDCKALLKLNGFSLQGAENTIEAPTVETPAAPLPPAPEPVKAPEPEPEPTPEPEAQPEPEVAASAEETPAPPEDKSEVKPKRRRRAAKKENE